MTHRYLVRDQCRYMVRDSYIEITLPSVCLRTHCNSPYTTATASIFEWIMSHVWTHHITKMKCLCSSWFIDIWFAIHILIHRYMVCDSYIPWLIHMWYNSLSYDSVICDMTLYFKCDITLTHGSISHEQYTWVTNWRQMICDTTLIPNVTWFLHMDQWVRPHIRMRLVLWMNESRDICEWVMWHIWIESCHTHE